MFRQDFTCPALLKSCNHPFPYGAVTHTARLSRRFRFLPLGHWPGPRSLAATDGVSVDVLSSGY